MMTRSILWGTSFMIISCAPSVLTADARTPRGAANDSYDSLPSYTRPKYHDAMCGPKCLLLVALAHGKQYSLNAVASMAGTDLMVGTTVEGMVAAATAMGLKATPMKTNLNALAADPRIAILLLKFEDSSHFVILDSIEEDHTCLLDGNRFASLSATDLASIWHGCAILISDGEAPRTDRLQPYVGTILQVAGMVIVVIIMGLVVSHLGPYLRWQPKRRA